MNNNNGDLELTQRSNDSFQFQQQNENNGQSDEKIERSFCWKIFEVVDLFKFLPVPKTNPVSSNYSMCGTIMMFTIFSVYILLTLIAFILDNIPRSNVYTRTTEYQNFTSPKIAFGFFLGEPFNETINNKSILYFEMTQIYKYKNVSRIETKIKIPLIDCEPDWLPDVGLPMLCPQNDTNMTGQLYETDVYGYPRIIVNFCAQNCTDPVSLAKIAAGGRVLIFIQNLVPDINLATGQLNTEIDYQTYQLFLLPGFYGRSQFTFQYNKVIIKPDFLRRWSEQTETFLTVENMDSWNSNVSIYNSQVALQVMFTIDDKQKYEELLYFTIIDKISEWGAFWGVLFTIFASIFLGYNSNQFYEKNKVWNNFDQKIGVSRPVPRLSNAQMQKRKTLKIES